MKRRPRGTGRIYQRGRLWWLKYYRNGIAVYEPSGTDSERQAQKLLQKRLGEIAADNFIEPKDRKVTVDQLYETHLTNYRINKKASLAGDEARWQRQPKPGQPMPAPGRLKIKFSGVKAIAVTRPRLDAYVKWCLDQGLENATINRDLAALRHAFKLAVDAEIIQHCPKFPKLTENPPRDGFIEFADYDKLRHHAHELWLRAIVECLSMGMRKGEIVGNWRICFADGMKVKHVDLASRTIRLKETKENKGRKGNVSGGDRIIGMTQELYTLMVACCSGKKGDDFVFTHENGTQVKDFDCRWKRLLRQAGLREDILIHDNRRSGVRNLVRSGVDTKTARMISGHKTNSVFERYNITDERDLHVAARKLEAAKQAARAERGQVGDNPENLHQKRAPVNISQVAVTHSIKYN